MQQEYSQPPILPSPHFRWVVILQNKSKQSILLITDMYLSPAKLLFFPVGPKVLTPLHLTPPPLPLTSLTPYFYPPPGRQDSDIRPVPADPWSLFPQRAQRPSLPGEWRRSIRPRPGTHLVRVDARTGQSGSQ